MNFPTHLDKINTIKIFAVSDFWARSPSQFSKDLNGSTFQYCFSCFTPPYSNPKDFYSFFDDNIRKNIKFFAIPRCIDRECFRDYGLNKTYDVISVGAMHNFYPFRVHMHSFLQNNASKLNIKYKNFSHCGVDFSHSDFVRDKYAQTINSSKILVSCGGKYHLAFNKIFEAMGCNTLYVGEKPYGEKELHLEDGFNYVAIDKNNFVDKILYYIGNNNELNRIIDNAKRTFEQYHHIDARAQDFVKIIEKII
jgi:hypothetical protein